MGTHLFSGNLSIKIISICRVLLGILLIGMVVIDLRYWLLFWIIVFIVLVPIMLTNPAGINLPWPSCLILVLD